jgi:hypothetical protein
VSEPKRGRGQPPFKPSPEQRRQVETLSGFGITLDQIALIIGCSKPTLIKHFSRELALGDAKATARVAQSLFQKAVNGDVASMIFWMKIRAKWSERIEHVGEGGRPLASAITVSFVGTPQQSIVNGECQRVSFIPPSDE